MAEVELLENGNVKLTISMSFRNCAGRKRIVTPDSVSTFADPLIVNLARAIRWQALIDEGRFSNIHELAGAIGKDPAYVARVMRLTLLAPEIVHAALIGDLPEGVGVEDLRQFQSVLWAEQKNLIGMK